MSAKQFFPWGTGNPTFYLVMLAIVAGVGIAAVGAAEQSATAVPVGIASFMGGGILGFLFGIPRYAASPSERKSLSDTEASAVKYQANTNLEQISDWLTKILVGVGLTQFRPIGEAFGRLFERVGASISSSSSATVVAGTLIVLCGASGFLFFYLWSRVYLPKIFSDADKAP
jgi:hypothetical protein